MRKVGLVLLLPFLIVLGLVGVALISVGGNGAQAQAAACVSVNGTNFNEKEVPNGWGPLVSKAAGVAGIPASVLAAQLEAESGWNPQVTSPVGAAGLAQFMPATWASYGDGGDVTNPAHAIAAQGRYMGALVKQLLPVAKSTGQDIIKLALAGYNAGPGAVQSSNGIPPHAETRAYVDKIMGTAQSKYGEACPAGGGVQVGTLSGKWTHPLPGSEMTSGYGPRPAPPGTAGGVLANFHYGQDFSTPGHAGTVLAVTDMKIIIARDLDGQFGTRVDGVTTDGQLTIGFYHMEPGSLRVKVGDVVAAGTPLGTEGASGNVSGRHLHLEFFTGSPKDPTVPVNPTVDPLPILEGKGVL
ncbi:SPBc2 prophage-derived uncharacterized transglycosylase YomI [Arthrobacter sp. Hiyo1]|uniref:transglycosylase SLT domain-containing protein n=1 Tax=Arthrobacter sp. Hiyo1 TaxID=1588020 RepID=UPI0006A3DF75|nr:transglycosylase SLT domain-containing protein [Arthrobacter sp. Hiyo1]GAP61406.1 SPBc2 prophage-derived uncharacterized transglycosylase YomI [Arthrobacter sp. Hiyo1]